MRRFIVETTDKTVNADDIRAAIVLLLNESNAFILKVKEVT